MDPDDIDVDPEEFEELPTTDVDVEARVHFGMTGSFPLRIAELFFADDGLYVAQYAYITPMFGLGARKHRREAAAMEAVYDVHGLDEVLLQADDVVWHSPGNVARIVCWDGGWLGRPKVGIYPEAGATHAYRIHDDDVAFEELLADLSAWGDRHGVAVERRSGVGFTPRQSLRRFVEQ